MSSSPNLVIHQRMVVPVNPCAKPSYLPSSHYFLSSIDRFTTSWTLFSSSKLLSKLWRIWIGTWTCLLRSVTRKLLWSCRYVLGSKIQLCFWYFYYPTKNFNGQWAYRVISHGKIQTNIFIGGIFLWNPDWVNFSCLSAHITANATKKLNVLCQNMALLISSMKKLGLEHQTTTLKQLPIKDFTCCPESAV